MRRMPLGSIPACAGEPSISAAGTATTRVDPRMRGGALALDAAYHCVGGRSPHARGSPQQELERKRAEGSIPACAGEPGSDLGGGECFRVDPRMRGGALTSHELAKNRAGRSPHARGSPQKLAGAVRDGGSIPACAGEPGSGSFCAAVWGVDPRMRGGAPPRTHPGMTFLGRSPHARGSPGVLLGGSIDPGSIPACAGEP